MRRTQSALIADFFQLLVGKVKHLLCLCDTKVQNVSIDADPELFLEHTGQIELADEELVGKLIRRNFLGVVRVQTVPNRHKVLPFHGCI